MKLQTSISPNYVKNWNIAKAIRELIQNYLDSRAEFECGGYLRWADGQGVAKDDGPGIEMRHLAMGISEKPSSAKGKYGEGLKLALLVFAREGRKVEIWSHGKKITPAIEYSPEYETELLTLEVEELPPHFAATLKGTSIKFDCTEEELEEGKSYFIEFAKRDKDFEWLDKDQISLPAGQIYVNGTRVGLLENALFSYHLNESEVGDIGNRDREVIDESQVRSAVSKIVANTSSLQVLKTIMEDVTAGTSWEVNNLAIWSWSVPSRKRQNWTRVANEVFRGAVFSSDVPEINSLANYQGMKLMPTIPYRWKELMVQLGAIKTAEQVLMSLKPQQKSVPMVHLEDWERKNLERAKEIVKKYYTQEELKVNIAEDIIIIGSDSDSNLTEGYYDREKKVIFIERKHLKDLRKFTGILLHEAVHAVTGAHDCTAEFEDALLEVSLKILFEGGLVD